MKPPRLSDADREALNQETRKFFQTINPFNKAEDGSVKTRDQIMVEILARRDEWMRSPPAHPAEPAK